MATYSVVTLRSAEKQILDIPFPFRRHLVHALVRMKKNPRPVGSEAIELDVYRLNLHGWRIVTGVRVAATGPT
jgi:mRNA-degrading endonuclease RelE of RelBE toxin-antitoxin system